MPFSFSAKDDGEPASHIYLTRSLSPLLSLSPTVFPPLSSIPLSLSLTHNRRRREPWQVKMPSAMWGSNIRGTTIYVLVLHQICSRDSFLYFSKYLLRFLKLQKEREQSFYQLKWQKNKSWRDLWTNNMDLKNP